MLLKSIFLGPVVGLVGMATPYLTKLLIDEVYPTQDVTFMHVLVGGVLAVSLFSAGLGALQRYYNLYVHARLLNVLCLLFFNHLQHLPMRFYDEHRVGEIMSRFQDVGKVLGRVINAFQTVFGQGIYLLLVPPFLFLLQWKLALIALISVPLTVSVTTLAGRALRKNWKHTTEAYADLHALQVETLSQIRTLKTLALEHHVFQKASRQIRHAIETQLRAEGLGQVVGITNGMLHALNTALVTWLGWTLILSREMSLGSYIAFTAYIGYMQGPITQLINLFSDFQQSAVHLARMFEYLDYPVEQDPVTAYSAPTPVRHTLRGHIALQDVSFGYAPGQRILEAVTLDVPPESITAIVGPSGSGKTTLLRLLTRMEQPDAGQILFDGTVLAQIPLPDLRRQVGVLWQEFSLLNGTIWDNLTLGLDNVSRACVDQITHWCRLDTLIQRLPEGYETHVAEWGASLSGGQRQRLALARTLLRDTPVLLLDEATSNIDIETESAILHDLFANLQGKTVVFVTHRVATATLADRICVLEAGRIVGLGTHHELTAGCDAYSRLNGLGSQVRKEIQASVADYPAPIRLAT